MFQQAIQDGNRGGGDGLTYNELLSSPFNVIGTYNLNDDISNYKAIIVTMILNDNFVNFFIIIVSF